MSNREYTDQEMQWGAQIGYLNFSADEIGIYQEQIEKDGK